MAQLSQELVEVVAAPTAQARLTQAFGEEFAVPTASARLSQMLVEPFMSLPAAIRLDQMVVEVFFRELPEPPAVYGVWPQEYNSVLPAIQGQMLRARRGQR